MSTSERLDAIEARLARIADPAERRIERDMGDVRLRVEDTPALVAALRAVLDLTLAARMHPGSIRSFFADDIESTIDQHLGGAL